MFKSVGSTIFTIVIILLLIYLIIWTVRFIINSKKKQDAETDVEAKAKQRSMKHRTIACSKNYWYNQREVEDCPPEQPVEQLYHYFDSEQECIKALILEMYDCALVRSEELARIARGGDEPEEKPGKIIIDPYAVDAEYDEFEYDFDQAVEELMETDEEELAEEAKQADDAELRAEIYDCWAKYVMQLYDMIRLNCNEEMKIRIRSKIMSYGHKDVKILMHSPE